MPDSPINVTPTEITDSMATLTWDTPEKDGGSPVTGYIIEKRHCDTTRWVKCNKKAVPDTVYTATDLIEDNMYEFRVTAENVVGKSKPSLPTRAVQIKLPYGE